MVGWRTDMVMVRGWLWWLVLKWGKTKARRLKLEKIIYNAKYELKK